MLFLSFLLLSSPSLIFSITSIQPPPSFTVLSPLIFQVAPLLAYPYAQSLYDRLYTVYARFSFYSPELELELPTSGSVVHSLIHLTTQADHANLP